MGHEKISRGGRSAGETPFAYMDFLSPQPPEGSVSLGYETRCEGRSGDISDGERVDRDGTVDGLCEGGFGVPFPPNIGTTGVAKK
jgi:hypothetical protein